MQPTDKQSQEHGHDDGCPDGGREPRSAGHSAGRSRGSPGEHSTQDGDAHPDGREHGGNHPDRRHSGTPGGAKPHPVHDDGIAGLTADDRNGEQGHSGERHGIRLDEHVSAPQQPAEGLPERHPTVPDGARERSEARLGATG